MKKIKSEFKSKFHLLYSQESSEKIIWSSSDSSDYENVNPKVNVDYRKQTPNGRKRKRRNRNDLKNISYLNVVYSECKQKIPTPSISNSPIIKIRSTSCSSPIVSKPQKCSTKDLQKSPIISNPQKFHLHQSEKSPILKPKQMLTIQSGNIRRKLFDCKGSLLSHNVKEDWYEKNALQNTKEREELVSPVSSEVSFSCLEPHNESDRGNIKITNEGVANKKTDLVKKVKTYFEKQFNTQPSSQHSISEYESTTQSNSKSNDEIDIISLTDDNEKLNSEIISSKDSSLDIHDTSTSKTFKFKKDGLAYRLNSLLKKQNASVSMWQHEKFLANNSKFSLPKGEYTAFRIRNVQCKYGCYLLDAEDTDDNNYNIIINNLHVNNVNLEANFLLKLYKPYECLTVNNCNVIVNALRFECDNNFKQ